jgi:hypothetical protein
MSEKSVKQKWINTFQILAAYLVAAWTFLQFVDWLLNRYNLSPNWVDLMLWTFIGIIPSLLIYLYHRERINNGIVKLREKILIPFNIILLGVVLFFAFGNTDLGATTKNVTFENAYGNLETKTFTKEEFREGIAIYNFEQLQKKDSTFSWLKFGIGKILSEDLRQNKNLSPESNYRVRTTDKIRDASLFYDKYVDGEFKIEDDNFTIKTFIRKATNAKILKEKVFSGTNLFNLIDELSVFIASEIDKKSSLQYIDLPVSEYMTNSLKALEAYAKDNYDEAYRIDKTFSLAYLEDAKAIMSQNRGTLEARDVIDKAFATKSLLPLQKQLEVLIQKNLIYGNFKEAEKQVKLQLEVDPNNKFYNSVLFSIYGETKNTEAFFNHAEKLFETNKSAYNGKNLSVAAMTAGFEDQLISALNAFELVNPSIKYLKVEPLIFSGQVEKAKNIIDEYKLSYTGNRNRIRVYDSIFNFLDGKNLKDIDLENFEGTFRSNNNEQILSFWLEDDRLIEYVKNQAMKPYIPAGNDAAGGGFIENYTYYTKLLKDENGEVFALKKSVFYWNSTPTFLFWKLDDNLKQAKEAFDHKHFDKAKALYIKAKSENPRHVYIDNILGHLDFKLANDSVKTIAQYQKHKGEYGPRKFWTENGRFYYKRQDDDINLPKVELLPINDSLYMDMTRLGTLMVFSKESNKQISKSYSLDNEKFKWIMRDEESNVFEKK